MASTNSTSPPAGVHASPVATPGSPVRRATSGWKRRVPSSSATAFGPDRALGLALALGELARDLAADRADLALEVAHAGLARVALDDLAQRLVGELELRLHQAVLLDLPRHQVALGDLELLLLGVAGQLDHLHPVAQRRRDRVELVRGGDEQHLREVERRGPGSGRGSVEFCSGSSTSSIALDGSPRKSAPILSISSIISTGLLDPASRIARMIVPGHRADVGAAVAADLRLVAHAADGDALELAAHGRGDRLAERGLAHARRARRSRGSSCGRRA